MAKRVAVLMMQKGSLKCSDRLTSAVADLYALFCTGQLAHKANLAGSFGSANV